MLLWLECSPTSKKSTGTSILRRFSCTCERIILTTVCAIIASALDADDISILESAFLTDGHLGFQWRDDEAVASTSSHLMD